LVHVKVGACVVVRKRLIKQLREAEKREIDAIVTSVAADRKYFLLDRSSLTPE
jgi:hypothetical protein